MTRAYPSFSRPRTPWPHDGSDLTRRLREVLRESLLERLGADDLGGEPTGRLPVCRLGEDGGDRVAKGGGIGGPQASQSASRIVARENCEAGAGFANESCVGSLVVE